MGQSRILAVNELAEAQVQAFQTVNDAVDALEKASNRILHIDTIGLTEYIVNESDFTRYQVFVLENGSADLEFKVPETVNTIAPNRVISVINKGLFNVTVRTVGSTGTDEVVITADGGKTVYVDDVEVNEISGGGGGAGGGGGTSFVTLATFMQDKPNQGDEVLRYAFTGIVDLAVNFAGSQGSAGTNPTSTATFVIKKNGTSFGTVAIDTAGAFTFIAVVSTTFNPGDVLTIDAPNPQDSTLADVNITLKGIRQ